MGSSNGNAAVQRLVLAILTVASLDTLVTGSWLHWTPTLLGTCVGLWAYRRYCP